MVGVALAEELRQTEMFRPKRGAVLAVLTTSVVAMDNG